MQRLSFHGCGVVGAEIDEGGGPAHRNGKRTAAEGFPQHRDQLSLSGFQVAAALERSEDTAGDARHVNEGAHRIRDGESGIRRGYRCHVRAAARTASTIP